MRVTKPGVEAAVAAGALGKRFAVFTIATVLATLVFGFITSRYALEVQANEPTPWVGLYERISAYGSELWILVLSLSLYQRSARFAQERRLVATRESNLSTDYEARFVHSFPERSES